MAPNSSTAVRNRTGADISADLHPAGDSYGLKSFGDNSFFFVHWYTVAVIAVAVLILSVMFIAAINWFLKERKCRKLRHRLIPMYTFDPNEEDEWDEEFMNSNQPLKIKDFSYQSIENQENQATSSR